MILLCPSSLRLRCAGLQDAYRYSDPAGRSRPLVPRAGIGDLLRVTVTPPQGIVHTKFDGPSNGLHARPCAV